MLDPKLIRDNPKIVKDNLKKRGLKIDLVDEWLKLDRKLRDLKQENDKLRHERNLISQKINECKKRGDARGAKEAIKKAKEIPERIKKIDEEVSSAEDKLRNISLNMPNLLDKKVPFGKSPKENKILKKGGKILKIKNIKSHVELAENLGLLDLKASAKITGEGFYVLKGELALLERALINFFLDFHHKKGRIEVCPPILANERSAIGTAHLPKFKDDMYRTTENLYLAPTAELPLTNLYQDFVLKEDQLSVRYCAYTPCFRTEAGKHGAETHGLFRVHQFDKVEMMTFCKPEESEKELKLMLEDAEKLVQMLKVPYRTIMLCSGDMGFKESITYDIETYSPFMKKYMETSSVSNCKDFQARRMNTKFWRNKTSEREYVHTLNGSGLALPRLMIAILENYQQADGSVKIPAVLQKYIGVKLIKAKKKAKKKK